MLDGSWSGWRVIPSGSTPDTPAAAICRNRLHIVVRGMNNRVWHGYIDLATGSWSGWRRIPGSTPSAPTLAAEEDLYLYLVVRGSDNHIYVNKYDCVADEWLGWHKVSSVATPDSPSAAIRNDGENIHILDMVVRGMNNGIWHGTINLNDPSFNGWHKIPGSTSSPPRLISTALSEPLYLAVRGMNNKIYINKFENDNWQG